jgi:hypothetical protein
MPVTMLLILVAVADQRHVLIPAGGPVDSTDDGRGLLDTVAHPRVPNPVAHRGRFGYRRGARVDDPATLPTARCEVIESGEPPYGLWAGAAVARDLSRSQNFFSDSSFAKRRRAEYPAITS